MASNKTTPAYSPSQVTGLLLAGGAGRRMGGRDKGLIDLGGRRLVEYVVERLKPQVGALLVSANRNRAEYAALFDCPVVADVLAGFAGPLAGIASGLEAAQTQYVLTAPCDSPLIVGDYAERMYEPLWDDSVDLSVAGDGERGHPVFLMLRRSLAQDLAEFLASGGRAVHDWVGRQHSVRVDFTGPECEMFLNLNSPEDLAALVETLAPISIS